MMDSYWVKRVKEAAYTATSEDAPLTTARALQIIHLIAGAAAGGGMEATNEAMKSIQDVIRRCERDNE